MCKFRNKTDSRNKVIHMKIILSNSDLRIKRSYGNPGKHIFLIMTLMIIIAILLFRPMTANAQAPENRLDIYDKSNLVAWSIVPFDSEKRGPEERAQMLNDLGITKLAYDWRAEHIPTFDQELEALKKHHIKLQAFWLPTGSDPANDTIIQKVLSLLERHNVKTELWVMVGGIQDLDLMSQEQKVIAMAQPLAYLAERAKEIDCSVGLYNHGGWFGEPENQLAVIHYLNMPNVGIVYNFSHSETQIQRFPEFFPKILPHLLCINLTGLISTYPATVVPIGTGDMEKGLIQEIKESGYDGPIGIINEDFAKDAKIGLQMNINGLRHILK